MFEEAPKATYVQAGKLKISENRNIKIEEPNKLVVEDTSEATAMLDSFMTEYAEDDNYIHHSNVNITNSLGQDTPEYEEEEEKEKEEIKREANKYKIIDLFWLFNPKLSNIKDILPNELHLLTISFNIIFGNLRIVGYNINNNSFIKNTAFLKNMDQIVSGTVYPASAFRLLYEEDTNFSCIEQLYNFTGEDWQSKRPIVSFAKDKGKIVIHIRDEIVGRTFIYNFSGWQREALLHACKFAVNNGPELMGQNTIRGR